MRMDRRAFGRSLAASAFAALATRVAANVANFSEGYGPLVADPNGVIDLPPGFSYRVISRFGETMDDGGTVPDRADGMGAIALAGSRVALIRNHELGPAEHAAAGAAIRPDSAYDVDADGRALPGGTTTIIYDSRTGRVLSQYRTLAGTIRNCAGGITPWGTWLTCEENVSRAGQGIGRDHGWVFEVPARARGLIPAIPLIALGRFNHEAAAVDPRTGIVYLTEDRPDGLFYRLLPETRGELRKGGRLQALGLTDGLADTRNWQSRNFTPGAWKAARWIDMDGVDSPADDLRQRGNARGAALFARGEGIHFGRDELYFCCTSGGTAKLGQVMRYRPSPREGHADEGREPGMVQLFVESDDPTRFNFGDNLTVAPNGHLIICEDQYTDVVDNHLRGITPDGGVYPLGRLRLQTELAGACFSPDGRTLFVNIYRPTQTLAITGPWSRS